MKTPFTFTTIDPRRFAGIAARSASVLALLLAFVTGARAQNPQISTPANAPAHTLESPQAQTPSAAIAQPVPPALPAFMQTLPRPQTREAAEPAGTSPKKDGDVNLTIHGHWALDIRNPDGTGARHVEFENALAAGNGDAILAMFLTGGWVPSDWAIELTSSQAICPLVGASTAGYCIIVPSLGTGVYGSFCGAFPQGVCFSGLTVSYEPPGAISTTSGAGLQLAGSFTVSPSAPAGTALDNLSSFLGTCQASGATWTTAVPPPTIAAVLNTVGPSQCLGLTSSTRTSLPTGEINGGPEFTSASPTPIPVSAGQIVQVTVTFTFS